MIIRPVVKVDQNVIGHGSAGQITKMLRDSYLEFARK